MKNTGPIRWGILACGGIARKFADDLAFVKDGYLAAVALYIWTIMRRKFLRTRNISRGNGS